MAIDDIRLRQIINSLTGLRSSIIVPSDFHGRMTSINRLLDNDRTSIVNTTLDFMVHAGTTRLQIETKNDTLNKILKEWQVKILNKNIALDIPRGLRDLSAQNYKERWKSSFLVLNVVYETFDFGSDGKWELPSKMWFSAGESVMVKGDITRLDGRKYYLGNLDNQIIKTPNKDIFIRKPYNSWYEDYPTPYLVRRGTLFNSMLKIAIISKQSDVIESIIPYLLKVQAGNDLLAQRGTLPTEDELKDLVNTIKESSNKKFDNNGSGNLIAPLSYDVNLEHFIPDLTKVFNPEILKSVDKDLLASLGWVELEGFSNNRQQTILNPKVLVEEVKDAVLDWSNLLEEVMENTLERNAKKHPNLANQPVRVIPGIIKTFVTDDIRSMLRSMYDRGIISKQTGAEDIADVDFAVEVDRRKKEKEEGLEEVMFPPTIQNMSNGEEINLEDQNKNPNSPEGNNFNQATIETIDDLPDEIRSCHSIADQVKYVQSLKNKKV